MFKFEGGTLLGSGWISGILPKYGGGTLLEGGTLLASVQYFLFVFLFLLWERK